MKTIEGMLVVGGTGFIGTHLVKKAASRGFAVTVISLNTLNDEMKTSGVEYLVGDVSSFHMMEEILTGRSFKYVVNLGGYVNHSKILDGGNAVIDAHFVGVQNLILLLDWNELKAFVQIGSSDEYGGVAAPQIENTREMPISPYALGKVAATHLLQMLYRTEGFPAIILRFFLVYGEGQGHNRFLPQIIKGCLNGDSFPTSKGEQLRDFSYIDDIVSGMFVALTTPEAKGEVINLASGIPVSIREVLGKVRDFIGKGEPRFGEYPYRDGESMALYADSEKARKLLKWEPKVCLEEGLRRTIEYYR